MNDAAEALSDEFLVALAMYRSQVALGREDSEDACRAFEDLIAAAPESFKRTLLRGAIAEGFMPNPDGYLPNGDPVFSAQAVADHMGLSVDFVASFVSEGQAIDPALVSKVH